MAKVPNTVEILPKIWTACVGRTNVTDRRQTDRQTTDGRATAYSERERSLKTVSGKVVAQSLPFEWYQYIGIAPFPWHLNAKGPTPHWKHVATRCPVSGCWPSSLLFKTILAVFKEKVIVIFGKGMLQYFFCRKATWRLTEEHRLCYSNMDVICEYPGGISCRWFFMVPCLIDMKAADGMKVSEVELKPKSCSFNTRHFIAL